MNSLVDNLLLFLHDFHIQWNVIMENANEQRRKIGLFTQYWVQKFIHMVALPTRRTQSYDDDAWRLQDDSLDLPSHTSSVSTTTLSTHSSPISSNCSGGLDNILVLPNDIEQSGALCRGEIRKSKSKMKSYLKRCKDAIIGVQLDDTCPITHHEAVSQSPSTSWYLDEDLKEIPQSLPASADVTNVEHNKDKQNNNIETCSTDTGHENESECGSKDDKSNAVIEETAGGYSQGSEILNNISSNGIENLIDKYFGQLYPDYVDHTRFVLIRQARDVLVCTFYGDLSKFEQNFLIPAAAIVCGLKNVCLQGSNLSWHIGWPLAVSGAVVLHLGALDESLVRYQDLYICIKPDKTDDSQPKLYAVWRKESSIVYHQLDPKKDPITPLAIEMLAEDLPQLLQNLLVGIERAIYRVPLDDLSFPTRDNTNEDKQNNNIDDEKFILSPINAPRKLECGIKRRELITKNKIVHNKYALKRITITPTANTTNHNNNNNNDNNNDKSENVNRNNELINVGGGDNNNSSTSSINTDAVSMPLFCLGGSFPHIDSDEESGDDMKKIETVSHLPRDIVAPRSIQDLPEKLLTSGIYVPGTQDRSGSSIIYMDIEKILSSGLNCYEIATILLYYNTIPISPTLFTIHLFVNESSNLTFLDILDNSLQLLHGHIQLNSILVSGTYEPSDKIPLKDNIKNFNIKIKYLNNETIKNYVSTDNLLIKCCGFYVHDQNEWIDFFKTLEPLQLHCVDTGKKLVSVLSDIRNLDTQGTPTRRQLHSQHRALSRALMDSDLQSLRRKGPNTIQRLQDKLNVINNKLTLKQTKNLVKNNNLDNNNQNISNNKNSNNNDFINNRLNEVLTIFNEVDRAAKKLEQLTEQRRERLREMTRQRALDDEINEVISWIRNDGEKSLARYLEIPLDCCETIKSDEQEFEKFYFISMKHISKGNDLYDASGDIEIMKENLNLLKNSLTTFAERLETTRERIEDIGRIHQLFDLPQVKIDDEIKCEMIKLADKINEPVLIERCKNIMTTIDASPASSNSDNCSLDISINEDNITATSTPEKNKLLAATNNACLCCNNNEDAPKTTAKCLPPVIEDSILPAGDGNYKQDHLHHHNDEDEEDHSKMADSGVGGCDRCEGNDKLVRTCSCQSFDDPKNACGKSNKSDDLDEDCFEAISKPSFDLQIPLQANAHLYCHTSTLQLDYEENDIFDQKTQKTLLLIMREMIGTERDYVRSLHYVIENYMQELLREDIPQALRGQRNVIFGNIERISEFHQQHFLNELESYEHHPLKVGAAFLRHESKFYLYALYNKNKPKSDSLMSEYGTQFFKSKQVELNDKMDLASYLLKPVQRMGKYALLLQQLMKACSNIENITNQEVLEDLEELQKAEEMVRFQLRHGNDLLAMDSLRDCDVNVKEQGRLLRQSEFLVWEGKAGKKSLRQVFLFEDLVLFSKARRFPDRKNLDIYIYKNSIKTSDIGLTAHIGDSPHKFEIWFRKRKPGDTWTLQTMSEDVKNAWTEEISKVLWKQAKRNREVRLAEMSSMGIGSKPCLDIRPSQNQINDRSISMSQLGKTPKLRNSFTGTLPESKSSKRPNSIISVSSSSSGGSSVSTSTASSASGCEATVSVVSSSAASSGCNSNSNSSTNSNTTCKKLSLNIPEAATIKTNCKKHQRSTTLVSQCSMESGIIADISLSPDECPENPIWPPPLVKNHNILRKSSSLASADQKTDDKNSNFMSDTITVHL